MRRMTEFKARLWELCREQRVGVISCHDVASFEHFTACPWLYLWLIISIGRYYRSPHRIWQMHGMLQQQDRDVKSGDKCSENKQVLRSQRRLGKCWSWWCRADCHLHSHDVVLGNTFFWSWMFLSLPPNDRTLTVQTGQCGCELPSNFLLLPR